MARTVLQLDLDQDTRLSMQRARDAVTSDLIAAASAQEWQEHVLPRRQFGLSHGAAGLALAVAECVSDPDDERARSAVGRLLETAVDALGIEGRFGLFTGVVGVGWSIHWIQNELGFSLQFQDVLDQLDSALATWLAADARIVDIDFTDGLAGVALYGMLRKNTKYGHRITELAIARILTEMDESDNEVHWPTLLMRAPRSGDANWRYALGLAHGMGGVASVLASAIASGIGSEDSAVALSRAIEWILRRKRFVPGSRYSPLTVSGTGIDYSWCWGDLGLAVLLVRAGRILNESLWEHEGMVIVSRGARGISDHEVPLPSGCLCHGYTGAAQMMNRLYQMTGDETCHQAATALYRCALDERSHAGRFGGFRFRDFALGGTSNTTPDRIVPGLMTGSAGAALGLATALSQREPAWDKLLLCTD